MSTEPSPAPWPDEKGFNEDVPCPKCQYDLRGLTVPRCPECGFEFAWADVPKWREDQGKRKERNLNLILSVTFGLTLTFFGVLATEGACLLLVLAPVLALLIAGAQAAAESLIISPVIAVPGNWKRFRAWWEGVLIGYGLSAVTIVISGYGVIAWDFQGFQLIPANLWPVSILTTAEACVVQWWVVRRRMRQWNDPIPSRRLFLACVLAKLVVAIPWAFCPFRIMKL